MMSPDEILNEICETPGWQPPSNAGSTLERILEDLQQAGQIIPRLDGWEATPKALRRYPFGRAEKAVPEFPNTGTDVVPIAQVAALIAAMLEVMPLAQVTRLVAAPTSPDDDTVRSVSLQLAREL